MGRRIIDGQATKVHEFQDFVWGVYLELLPHRNYTSVSVHVLAMLFEYAGTIASPGATWDWAIDPVREVRPEVSVPLLPTVK